jgi:hypothetical protein
MMNFVSPIKMPLECAEASLKDTKYFTSEIILVTTNNFQRLEQKLTKADCIDDIHALWRRFGVFDFSHISRNGGVLRGNIYFRRFDVNTNAFVTNFVPGVLPESFPVSCEANEFIHLLGWMKRIVSSHHSWAKAHCVSKELTPEMRQAIDDYEFDDFQPASEGYGSCCWGVATTVSDFVDMCVFSIRQLATDLTAYLTSSTTGCLAAVGLGAGIAAEVIIEVMSC